MFQELTFTVQELLILGGLFTAFILGLVLLGCALGRSSAPDRSVQPSAAGHKKQTPVSAYDGDIFHDAMREDIKDLDERIETISQ